MGCKIITTLKNLKSSPLLGIAIVQTFLGCFLVCTSIIYLLDLIAWLNFPKVDNSLSEYANVTGNNNTNNTNSTNHQNTIDMNRGYQSWFVSSSFCILLGLIQFLYNFRIVVHPQKLESKWLQWCGIHGLLSLLIAIQFCIGLSNDGTTSQHLRQSTQRKATGFFATAALNFICTFISISYLYITIGCTALRKNMNQIFGVKTYNMSIT